MAIVVEYKAYYKIGEIAKALGIEPHTIRYWEGLFTEIRPEISASRKLYTRNDLETFAVIQYLTRNVQLKIDGARATLSDLRHSGELATLKQSLVEYRKNERKTIGTLAALRELVVQKDIIAPPAQNDAPAPLATEDKDAEIRRIQASLNIKSRELEDYKEQLIQALDAISEKNAQIEHLHDELTQAQTSLSCKSSEIEDMRSQWDNTHDLLDAKVRELDTQETEYLQALEEISSQKKLLDQTNELIASKAAEIDNLHGELNQANELIANKSAELDNLHGELGQANELIASKAAEI